MPYVFPIIESIFLPPGLFLLVVIASLLLVLVGRKRSALIVGAVGCVLLYLSSVAPFADLLILPLEDGYGSFNRNKAAGAGYVVVLGGGIIPKSPEAAGKGTLAPEALKRLVYGAHLASELRLPLILSGGIVPSHPAEESEAVVARRTVATLGLPESPILIEGKSRNTWENAARVEQRYHPRKVVLVTSAYHMPRSVLAFNRNHIQVVPAPTDYLADRAGYTFYDYLPNATSLRETSIAMKEYLGYLYYRFFLFHHQA